MPVRGPKGSARAGAYRKRVRRAMARPYLGPRMSLLGRRGLVPVTARVHTFKRLGAPMMIVNSGSLLLPSLQNAASGTTFDWLRIANNSGGFVGNTIQFGGSFAFMLSQCAATTEITSLFDNYRIRKVVLRFDYSMNSAPSGVGSVVGAAVPLLHCTPDYDDNTVPTTRNDVLQNSYARTIRLDRSFTMTLTPRAQNAIAGGANLPNPVGGGVSSTAAGGLLPIGTWLDCNSPQIPHFGVKFWLDNYNDGPASSSVLTITPTYYLECKNVQ